MEAPEEAQSYLVSFPRTVGVIACPFPGFGGREINRTNLRIHFIHCHVQYTLVILEEGNCPHPWCLDCDMFVPW